MILNTTFITTTGIILAFFVPFLILLLKNKKLQNILAITLFAFYIAILFVGVWGHIEISQQSTKIIFDFSYQWCNKQISTSFANIGNFDVCVNLVMMIPLGMFACFFLKTKSIFIKLFFVFLIGLFAGTFIETSQFILPISRSVQLSDVLFNAISTLIGGIIFTIYQKAISLLYKQKK